MHHPTDDSASEAQRNQIDPVFKQVLTVRLGQLNIPVQTQVEVSRLPRTMDALVVLNRNPDWENVRSKTPFGHFRQYNQVEFKGRRDPLRIDGYHLIVGRTHLYLSEHDISPSI